jgi:hypothetical protein
MHLVHSGPFLPVDAKLVAAAVEPFHPLDDLFAGTGDDEAQQRFQKRDGRHRRRKELRRVDGHDKAVIGERITIGRGGLSECR